MAEILRTFNRETTDARRKLTTMVMTKLAFRTEVDPFSVNSIDDAISRVSRGEVAVVLSTHTDLGDMPQVEGVLLNSGIWQPGKNLHVPIGKHQHGFAVKTLEVLVNGNLHPITTHGTVEKGKATLKDLGKGSEEFYNVVSNVGAGDVIHIAPSSTREAAIGQVSYAATMRSVLEALNRRKQEDPDFKFFLLPVGIGLNNAKVPGSKAERRYNFFKKYKVKIGKPIGDDQIDKQLEEFIQANEIPAGKAKQPIKLAGRWITEKLENLALEQYRFHPKDVAIIGDGQVGGMLGEVFGKSKEVSSVTKVTRRDSIAEMVAKKPQIIVLATPNPVGDVLTELALELKKFSPRDVLYHPTIVLPQNGVEVDEIARGIIGGKAALVRASILTPVSLKDDGTPSYNAKKLAVGLASMDGSDFNLNKVANLMVRSGFEVELFDNAENMAWNKLLLNTISVISVVTGLTPKEIYEHEELCGIALKTLEEQVRLMRKNGIKFENFPGANTKALAFALENLHLAEIVPPFTPLRNKIATVFAGGRNQPTSGWRKIEAGKTETETSEYYLKPYFELARKLLFQMAVENPDLPKLPLFQAISAILEDHFDVQGRPDFDLREISQEERIRTLIKTYRKYEEDLVA